MTATETTSAGEWVPFQSAPDADPFMGFGRAEFLYCMLAELTPRAVETASKMGIADDEMNDAVRMVAGSSLYAQGFLDTLDGETYVPVKEAALISRASTLAEGWITLGAVGDDAGDALIGIIAGDALLLVGPGPFDGFVVSMVPGGEQLLDVVGAMVASRLDATEPGGPPSFVSVERPSGDVSLMFVRRHPTEADAFEVALGDNTKEKPPILPGAKTGDDVDELLAGMLGVDPESGAPLVAETAQDAREGDSGPLGG